MSIRSVMAAAAAAVLTMGTCAMGLVATTSSVNALDNNLALTPQMGFNNWNSTQCTSTFNAAMVESIADLFVSSGLKAAGYEYVNLDDCWALPNRDANGN